MAYIHGTYANAKPISPKLPAQTADSNRGALESFQQTKFKTFCPTCKGVYAVKSVIGIEQNSDSTEYKVILYCPAEHSRSVTQMVARSENQKDNLRSAKAKSAAAKKKIADEELADDVRAVAMDEPPEPIESDMPKELRVEERGDM